LKRRTTLVAIIILTHALTAQNALAITAEVARKCGELADKAYPPRVPGNPAAGHLNGTSQDVENYFNKCVANGGKAPDGQAPKGAK
jgi:predicted extracellular nuclease